METTRPSEEPPQQQPVTSTTNTNNTTVTDDNSSRITASDDSMAAKPQAKTPVKRYHSFSSAEPRLSMTESASGNQLNLHTLECHEGHLHRKHEMESTTKKASSR